MAAELLQAELDVANAQNMRLNEENVLLRQKLSRLVKEERSTAATNLEAKLTALRLEEERDQMYENLEKVKVKYNKLYTAYLEKVKRCKALEGMFQRQKTLTGLVMKSTVEQTQQEQEVTHKQQCTGDETENLERQVAKLKTALDEAYNIIDDLEFELEGIDYLELENQRLRQATSEYASKTSSVAPPAAHQDERPPSYAEVDGAVGGLAAKLQEWRDSHAYSECESCNNGITDIDSATLERVALTNSLIETAEVESNCLRRELLRSRLQNTLRPKNASHT